MRFEGGRTDDFYGDTMDLVLELFGPIEWMAIWLYEDHFSLENTDSLKVSFVIFLQVYHLVI